MLTKNNPIGVMDSGVGGLTTVKELQKLISTENLIYFGDNKNVPYGNKTEEEIIHLTRGAIEFLISEGAKVIAVACNTISTIIDKIAADYDVKIIKVIDPVVDYIKNSLNVDKVGLIATNFTVKSGYYDKMLGNIKVYGKGSPELAAMVDSGKIDREEAKRVIRIHMEDVLRAGGDIKHVILGCTHYPIIKDIFEECYPEINFINPAYEQAVAVINHLKEKSLLKDEDAGSFKVYTTGASDPYNVIMNMLSMNMPEEIIKYEKELALL